MLVHCENDKNYESQENWVITKTSFPHLKEEVQQAGPLWDSLIPQTQVT